MRAYLLAALLLLMLICTCRGGDENPPNENLHEDEYLADSDLETEPGKVKKIPKKCLFRNRHSPYEINECMHKDLFEGDVKLADWQKPIIDKLIGVSEANEHHIGKRGASKNLKRWDFARDSAGNKILPYVIDVSMNAKGIAALNEVVAIFESKTCIRLKIRTEEHSWINFFKGGGCYSYVGRVRTGAQQISIGIGCEYKNTVIHEIFHALGFWHEQSRPDRDEYVTIVTANIQTGKENNFKKYDHNEWDSFGSPYDTKSIMHYGAYAFSSNRQPTIVNKDTGKAIETNKEFSVQDIFQVNKMYECNVEEKTCAALPTITGNGDIKETKMKVYYNGQEVTLGCDDGYTPQYYVEVSRCENGAFTPSTLKCVKESSCEDATKSCISWTKYGYCTDKYVSYMSKNCKKSCGYKCDGGCSSAQLPKVTGQGVIKSVATTSFAIGGTVSVDCAVGYEVAGAKTSTCGAAGFTPSTLVCNRLSCSKTELPKISGEGKFSVVKDAYDVGESVQLICKSGSSVQGASSATCGSKGFSPAVLTCAKDCAAPVVIATVSVKPSKSTYKHGDAIEYVCAAGEPDATAVMKQTCNNGKFQPQVKLLCTGCTKPPTISGPGKLSTGQQGKWALGETVQLTCAAGYSVSGASSSKCETEGFKPSTLICKKDTTTGKCEDKRKSCAFWAEQKYCTGEYVIFMSRNCQKSCDTCGECEDQATKKRCVTYAKRGYCTSATLKNTMEYLCVKTCQLCEKTEARFL